MYAALWRKLPGPWWVRSLILFAGFVALMVVCVLWIFPLVEPYFAPIDVTVDV